MAKLVCPRRDMNDSTKIKSRFSQEGGFTLVEMVVAVGLFAVVSLVCIGALLSLVAADRKAQALQSVMNNLNISIDDLVRNARMGTVYHCGSGPATVSSDCSSGDVIFAFEPYGGNVNTADQWVYEYDASGAVCGQPNTICKSINGGSTWLPVTAPEVKITSMQFYVIGTTPGDAVQPRVIVTIVGSAASTNVQVSTVFHLEATAVQRVLDL